MATKKYLDYNGLQKVAGIISNNYLKIDGSVLIDGMPFSGDSVNHFAYCSVSANSTTKNISLLANLPTSLTNGMRISVIFVNGNSVTNSTITLNIGGVGRANVYRATDNVGLKMLTPYTIVDFIYFDGLWYVVDDNPSFIIGSKDVPINITSTSPGNVSVFTNIINICKSINNPVGVWVKYNNESILCWLNTWAKSPLGIMVPCFMIPTSTMIKYFAVFQQGPSAQYLVYQFSPIN